MFDGFLDLFHGHAVGFFHVAAILANDGQKLLRHARRAVHHQVRVRNAAMNLFDAPDGQDVARGLAAELVGTVARADGNRQRIELCALDKVSRLLGVGQQLFACHGGFGAMAVFFVTPHGLE